MNQAGEPASVQAWVTCNIEMDYFAEFAYVDLKMTGVGGQVWGTSTLGYDKDDGYGVITRLSTLPEPLRTTGGTFDQPNRAFAFKGPDYGVNIRFHNPDRFTVETFVTPAGANSFYMKHAAGYVVEREV